MNILIYLYLFYVNFVELTIASIVSKQSNLHKFQMKNKQIDAFQLDVFLFMKDLPCFTKSRLRISAKYTKKNSLEEKKKAAGVDLILNYCSFNLKCMSI